MAELTRRKLAEYFCLLANPLAVRGSIAAGGLSLGAERLAAQDAPPAEPPRFGFHDVVRRAQDLAAAAFDPTPPALPDPLKRFDFDTWRDIRFRPDKAFLNFPGSLFRLQLFHLGHLFLRPVTVNIVRDGIPTPVPYTTDLFDFGHTKAVANLPVNLGFAGFRLHFPLNNPTVFDEVIAFLGVSYFRFLGRHQRYGLSARGLAVNAGTTQEEFPFFREFWIETPQANAEHATIYALLDGAAATGAYKFDLYPGVDSVVEVTATLFPRKTDVKFGLAPLTSMFFIGENDHRFNEDFRRELHDSDGLLVNTGTGEWIWRPLRNPDRLEVSAFIDHQIRGFGLLQRDRDFDHYQDLDLAYELRPSYFVEPHGSWGEGHVELVEFATTDEANDNIVVSFVPKDAPEQGHNFGYRIVSSLALENVSPNGRVVGTYQTAAKALGSPEPVPPGSHRFIIDFAGGDLAFYAQNPNLVEVVASASQGKILRSWLVYNPHVNGFRATIDLQLVQGQSADLRAFLRAGTKALTETWTYPWHAS
ncbi:MAG TPA: glucan biosynthesis protein G [Methylovirgula sp.]|nr:glucan biosynthesis protein G [Methylovirgula sp.]